MGKMDQKITDKELIKKVFKQGFSAGFNFATGKIPPINNEEGEVKVRIELLHRLDERDELEKEVAKREVMLSAIRMAISEDEMIDGDILKWIKNTYSKLAYAQKAVEAISKIKAELNEFNINGNVDCRIEAVINEYERKEREK